MKASKWFKDLVGEDDLNKGQIEIRIRTDAEYVNSIINKILPKLVGKTIPELIDKISKL